MSNIYVTEPHTSGKVILKTTVGEIEIELWSKETPKACRNFVQLCMEGYYDDTAFHRLVRSFIVQGGDPTGTGEGGESIYGKPFKTETHSRLSFNRRGLVGMACLVDNMNSSQFFFTLGPATELNGKHTLFGRVIGETLFNMLRLGEGEVGSNEKPSRLHRIVNTSVIMNPYDDIVLRQLKKKSKVVVEEVRVTATATKNFSLLSFGEEAEEEEQVTNNVIEQLRKKGKSAHDLLDDARLSSQSVQLDDPESERLLQTVLELDKRAENLLKKRELDRINDHNSEESQSERIAKLRQEGDDLRRQLAKSKFVELERQKKLEMDEVSKIRELDEQQEAEEAALARWEAAKLQNDELDNGGTVNLGVDLDTFSDNLVHYKAKAKEMKKNKAQRETTTLILLKRFSTRLNAAVQSDENLNESENTESPNKFSQMDDWMRSPLVSDSPGPTKQVLDPSVPNPDRYDLYDPRNPLNIRKRSGQLESIKDKKSRYI